MDFEHARFNMVEQQLRPWDITRQEVLDLFRTVRRELFVLPEHQKLAFCEAELPIGCGQFMLKPIIEGKVLQFLELDKSADVLEIGTGSGWFAALLGAAVNSVVSLEIEPSLAQQARANLQAAGVRNVEVMEADGCQPLADKRRFDLIIASGAISSIPACWHDQLKPGGQIFAFVGEAPLMQAQLLQTNSSGDRESRVLFETVVPALDARKNAAAFLL